MTVKVAVEPDVDFPTPPDPSTFLTPVWTSPSWWATAIVAVFSIVTGIATTFGHPLPGQLPDSVVGAAALLAAAISTAVLAHARSKVRAAAITASAATRAAHYDAIARMHSATVTAAATRHATDALTPGDRPPARPRTRSTATTRKR